MKALSSLRAQAMLVAAGALSVALVAAAALPAEPERTRILAHGPWPPPPALDPGNAYAGRPQAIALGEALFFEPRLAADGRLACAGCHQPQRAFADGRRRARANDGALLARNTPSLWNAAHERWFGWDGASDSVWSQALRVFDDPREMATSGGHLRRLLARDEALACRWQQAFGAPADDDELLRVQAAKAIGAFVATLVSAPSAFDRYRDAVERSDAAAAARYPADARRGLALFVGRGRCSLCHAGPRFSNGEFADIGASFFVRPGEVDPGRHGGITALRAGRYHLLSRWADRDPATMGEAFDPALKTRHVELQHRNFGEFKVPSLRNAAQTSPYLHDGQLATLAAVIGHYSELKLERLHADGERILEPLHLKPRERRDLLAFLSSLSDPAASRWQRAPASRCMPQAKAANR